MGVGDPLQPRVHSHRLDIGRPVVPVCFPVLGSRCHSASVISLIRKAEITRVAGPELSWNVVQDACEGNGKSRLKSVSSSLSDLQCHLGSDPKEREGISASAFFFPGMCTGVSGQEFETLIRNARARMRWAAILECFDAMRVAQLTVGELSLRIATCRFFRSPPTCSTHSHNSSNPAISRSELVRVPVGLSKDTTLLDTSGGHS